MMRKFSLVVLLGLVLSGCGEQPPAEVVAAHASLQRNKTLAKGMRPQLRIPPSTQTTQSLQSAPPSNQQQTMRPTSPWSWPAKGASTLALKGLDITGYEGAPVTAASSGEVVYSGNSLKGYGNLIIIKHANYFLSAYAHNRKNMVKEGEKVSIGQKIAEMGQSGTNKVKLHFEVRYKGKPIDPYEVLPTK